MRQGKETRIEIDKLVIEYAGFPLDTPTDFVSFRDACTLAREIIRLRRARGSIAKRLRRRSAKEHCAQVKRIHRRRRRAERCINNAQHGKAYRGGRCWKCWMMKLAAERHAYAEARS